MEHKKQKNMRSGQDNGNRKKYEGPRLIKYGGLKRMTRSSKMISAFDDDNISTAS